MLVGMQAISMLCSDQMGLIMQCFSIMVQGVKKRKGPLPENGLSDPIL